LATDEPSGVSLNWRISNGRAATTSRLYFVANELRYMWVLTFAEAQGDRHEVIGLVSEFARRLRAETGGVSFPYWYSPEMHPKGHLWHVNIFVPQWLAHPMVESVWGHGFVWVTDFETTRHGPKGEPLGLCRTPREGHRRASQYGCKYAQKDWSPEHVGRHSHRYEVAKGFAPEETKEWVSGPREAEQIVEGMVADGGGYLINSWDSNDDPEWGRPPARKWQW